MSSYGKVLVTGGAGYVGAMLVPELLQREYQVKVLDAFMFDKTIFSNLKNNQQLEVIEGDIRDKATVQRALAGVQAVIHLAAISNDPCSDLAPRLTQEVNYDAIGQLVRLSQDQGVERFIAASSSSVYGIKEVPNVTEDLQLEPITLYARLKAESEKIIRKAAGKSFTTVALRTATVCGFSPRMRLDLTVNILTSHAVNKGLITVFGGRQKRPNIHIKDVVAMYADLLTAPAELINGDVFNYGTDNYTVLEIAEMVRGIVGQQVEIKVTASNDDRSYHISSQKIKEKLGYVPKHSIQDAIRDVRQAFHQGLIPDYTDNRYYNIKKMQEIKFT